METTFDLKNLTNLAVLFFLQSLNTDGKLEKNVQPHTTPASLKGDVLIGLLFSLHHQPKQRTPSNTISCGKIREMYGIQRTEVTFRTVDQINRDPAILPNVTLGVEVRDSCWYAPVALRQSIEFIRDAISLADGGSRSCGARAEPFGELSRRKRSPLIGVIGPGSSSVALQVQNLLQLFQIPQIGYSTTSRDLSDKSRFGYFMRVVPSDYYQAKVMVDVVKLLNWTYVSAVNTDENYGQSGIQAFRELAEKANVCIAKEGSVLSNAEDKAFDDVLLNLKSDENARVVVCFCEGMTIRGLLAASRRLNLTGWFLFLGSDGWADRSDVTEGFEHEARGSISIRIHSPSVSDFDDYYFNLNPFNNTRNPWFREFWEDQFNCKMPPTKAEPENEPVETHRICTGKEKLSEKYKQEPKMSFVVKAIYAMAHGLHNMIRDTCGAHGNGLCPEMLPFNGSLFKNYLLNVSFKYGEEVVNFDNKGDPPGRYNIMNFQLMPNGSYEYVQVGNWMNGSLVISRPLQYGHGKEGEKMESVCSKPCAPGYYRNFQTGGQEQKCCWACVPCNHSEILWNDTTCKPCKEGYKPNVNKTACDEIPPEFTKWTDTEAIIAIVFSCLGFLSTAITGAVFLKYNDTPVVKSSTRELSYLILAGMCLSHAATFCILAKPSRLSCNLTRILPGFSFAMIYASLLTKTNRIARILAGSKKRFPTKKLRFMSATAQVFITSALIGIEAIISSAMLMVEPAAPHLRFFTHPQDHTSHVFLECNTTPWGVLAPLAFDFFLIALCTLYALKTRNVPENFNEAKFIGFAMYTTCVIWIAFVPIYFKSGAKVITMCMCVTLSAMVTLAFLFFPKVYIILLRPERNNRAFFTTSKTIRCHIGSKIASAPPSCPPVGSPPSFSPDGRDCSCMDSQNCPKHGPFIGRQSWTSGRSVKSNQLETKTEKRTLSCQTDSELIQALVSTYCQLLPSSNELKKFLHDMNENCRKKSKTSNNSKSNHLDREEIFNCQEYLKTDRKTSLVLQKGSKRKTKILEENVAEEDTHNNEDDVKFKRITIKLGDAEEDNLCWSSMEVSGSPTSDNCVANDPPTVWCPWQESNVFSPTQK